MARFQCIIPCIDGLFDEPHNAGALELLYTFATWHDLSKLRAHKDTPLSLLDIAKMVSGPALREFARVTCPTFPTVETRAEYSSNEPPPLPLPFRSLPPRSLPLRSLPHRPPPLKPPCLRPPTSSWSTRRRELAHPTCRWIPTHDPRVPHTPPTFLTVGPFPIANVSHLS